MALVISSNGSALSHPFFSNVRTFRSQYLQAGQGTWLRVRSVGEVYYQQPRDPASTPALLTLEIYRVYTVRRHAERQWTLSGNSHTEFSTNGAMYL